VFRKLWVWNNISVSKWWLSFHYCNTQLLVCCQSKSCQLTPPSKTSIYLYERFIKQSICSDCLVIRDPQLDDDNVFLHLHLMSYITAQSENCFNKSSWWTEWSFEFWKLCTSSIYVFLNFCKLFSPFFVTSRRGGGWRKTKVGSK